MHETQILAVHLERHLHEKLQGVLIELLAGPLDHDARPLVENGRIESPAGSGVVIPQDKVGRGRTNRGQHFERPGAIAHHVPEAHKGVGPLFHDILQHGLPRLPVGVNV